MIGILICGPSGVGKTSNLNKILEKFNLNPIIIDPDKRKEKTQEERSTKAREEVFSSINEKKDFVYSGSCLRGKTMQKIFETMKEKGYRIIMVMVYSSLRESIRRIAERKDQLVPEKIIKEFHSLFKRKAESYMNNPLFDEVLLYNNEEQFMLLLDKKDKKIHCYGDKDFFFDISPYCRSSGV
jgi:predicted ABC-type ATPase